MSDTAKAPTTVYQLSAILDGCPFRDVIVDNLRVLFFCTGTKGRHITDPTRLLTPGFKPRQRRYVDLRRTLRRE